MRKNLIPKFDVLHYSKCPVFNKKYHMERNDKVWRIPRGKKHEKEQLLDLLDKDIKSAILNIFKELEEAWQVSIWKNATHQVSFGKCKLKHWDTITYILKKSKSRTNADDSMEQQEHLLITVGMQNDATVTLENSLAVSYKTKHTLNHTI